MRIPTWLGLALVPFTFFLTGFLTLDDYGVNVDEPFHFTRGQALIHLYLTGSKTYDNLPGFKEFLDANAARTASNEDVLADHPDSVQVPAVPEPAQRFSSYMQPSYSGDTILKDVGHPPLPDILAAGFNEIFFEQLGWLGDIPSYHLFEILIATLGIALVMRWAYLEFGLVASLFAGLALALHPMYLGESRFNIKDPAETTFYIATLFCLWNAVRWNQPRKAEDRTFHWLLGAGISFGAALATKFNALFMLPIAGLWLFLMVLTAPWHAAGAKPNPWRNTLARWFAVPNLWGYVLGLVVAGAIVYISWPHLWGDTPGYLTKVWNFYIQLGTSEQYATDFITPGGWNAYPLLDVLFRAPLSTLLLAVIGFAGFVRYRKSPQFATLLLWGVWLLIPILRVTLPGKALYGATRQIMECLPAIALFTGVGASLLVEWVSVTWKNIAWARTGASLALALLYAPIVVTLIQYHPNPQLFYNSLIGGLNGAHRVNFPFWDNTMNNAYVAGIDWLNDHAGPNSKLSLVTSLRSSLPPNRLRTDIALSNVHFSGLLQEGEYIMEVLPLRGNNYISKYVDTFLEPVYTYTVDGVPLLSVWHNDPARITEKGTIAAEPIKPSSMTSDGQSLLLDFGAAHSFARLEFLTPPISSGCAALTEGALSVSLDGTTYKRLENIPFVGVNRPEFRSHDVDDYLLAGDRFQYVSISPNPGACLLQPEQVHGWIYED